MESTEPDNRGTIPVRESTPAPLDEEERKERAARAHVKFMQANFEQDARDFGEAKWLFALSIALTALWIVGAFTWRFPDAIKLQRFIASVACTLAWCAAARSLSRSYLAVGSWGGNFFVIWTGSWALLYLLWFWVMVVQKLGYL